MELLDLKNPFGAPVYHEKIVSSTMDAARILAGRNESHGTVITADFQEAGRGRLKRPWTAEHGKNLLFTVLLCCKGHSSIPQALTLRTGLAVSLAIEDLSPSLSGSVQVKWPNDIMINPGRNQAAYKAAGILSEADGKNVFIGVGVNIAQKEFPGDLLSKAGSIIQAFPALPENARFLLLEKILFRLYLEIENGTMPHDLPWQERLTQRLYKKGEQVSFVPGSADSGHLVEGLLSGLGPGGELLIIPNGEKTALSFVTGELRVYDPEN